MIGPGQIAISFQGFFDNELKDLIKSMPNSRYESKSQVWILPIADKDPLIDKIGCRCIDLEVKIEDVPEFVKDFFDHPIPYTLRKGLSGIPADQRHDYNSAKQDRNLDDLPEIMR